ncbi:dicer-like endonuclease [Cryphonectria parasitica EP155]|uniref:Dicer-like protein 1 n=2 Tax=Cryphonectria parasitica TaxID=5116 RepID=DCL1_CRYPA|nr:dicer-like endonuclease [Cryphonectria parasitica EP155]Q2VF19.1 RecName: Full=Dicer-like protein 1; Includes: RecName: Full=Endoribonuclease DCL-1; Includes: RecName: Full=ATP-dependent helicase DCL-1 [Cryphonectria parasitica]ABB00356.1 dicer-like protein 1 [Cryphonectria parasitica]KAF3767855.1 dicer-like endonuclease [Cryphonectria parasitica EP155]
MGDPAAHEMADLERGFSSEDDAEYRSGDDEASKFVENEPSKRGKISQKKKIEQTNFAKWMDTNQKSLTRKAVKQSVNQDNSLAYMIRSWEGGEKIITSPRDYQMELFERAKQQNTIAVLDTGSGKTLIAALLLDHTVNQELEDRAKGLPRRIAFFLVEKVALAFQQHAVLECNLAHSVAVFSGESIKNTWTKGFWETQLADHEVIVCTAEILNQCLQYAYIRIDQINLLVFDEAHHTKKNHPYARIIKDYYASGKDRGLRLPRIFGMTASPVDALIDVRQAAIELEGLLHSRIATTADPDALRRAVGRPKKEIIYKYNPLVKPIQTMLTFKLRPLIANNKQFSKAFAFSEAAARELGTWFVDRMWQLFLEDEELLKLEAKTERSLSKDMAAPEVVEKHRNAVRSARELIRSHEFPKPEPGLLSSKLKTLSKLLEEYFTDSSIRCIVFVERRWTAKLLTDFFESHAAEIPGLKVGSLMGANAEGGSSQTSFREQIRTILSFKKGNTNCIFATSVAEEGLDIPDCNLIIRFDICKTMIQYIQSRGRARQADSTYIHLIEGGNGDHRRIMHQNAENEKLLRRFCNTQPEDRLLKGSDYDMDFFLRQERNQRQYTIKSTGARLTYKNSLPILQAFLNTLRNQDDYAEGMDLVADYSILSVQGGFICEVMMPPLSPVTSAIGKVYSTKQVAKCSAAFELCFQLIQKKFLDDHLRSKFVEKRHVMANARLAVSSKNKAKYDMRLKPQIWAELGVPEKLYATVLILSKPSALERPSRPLFILTRTPLPQLKPFLLFLGPVEQEMTSDLVCQVLNCPITPTEEDLQLLTKFTLKIFVDIFNKKYAANAQALPYFFAPTNKDHVFLFSNLQDPRNAVDWPLLRHVADRDAEAYTGDEPEEFFQDKYIVDPHDGARRFWLQGIRKDLTCTSPVPADVEHQPTHRQWKRREVPHDILHWSLTAWKATREAHENKWKENQPVVVGKYATLRRNFLADINETSKNPFCYFVLEPMRISPLPVDVVAMAYLLPSIIHRIEQNLIALDACRLLQLDIHPDLALEALTKDSDNQGEDERMDSIQAFEPVNFQPGMGANYERLELLGDSFLKMATTIAVFTLIPNKDEFDYHCERMVMICNQNLFGVAKSDDLKLHEYIRSKSFERGTWYPVLKLEFGKTHLKTLKQMDEHRLADKSIADVCEALIGAAYMTTRKHDDYDLAVRAVTRLVNHKQHPMTKWDDYHAAYVMPGWQTMPANAAELDMAQKIHEATGYQFKHPRVLRSAFRHPSRPYVFDKVPHYQRLEFLGDALFDMACVDYLFHIAPDEGPQWLTEHKMAMVSNQFLGCLAVSLGFHKFILHHHASIGSQIHEYVTEITEARRAAEDAAEAAGKPRSAYSRDYWVEAPQPPKCIPDVLEAYVGAIFVDSKYDYSVVQQFFHAHVLPFFASMRMYDTFANKHPVTFFTQYVFETFGCHAYGLHAEEMPVKDDTGLVTGKTQVVAGILLHGQVVEGAVRDSGRYAKIAAARKALDKLRSMTRQEFLDAYKCDCKPGEAAEDISESATAI